MSLSAQILAGDPPSGLGPFLRDAYVPGPWNYVLINAWRGDASALAATARAAGLGVWLYGTPDHFRPSSWREGLAYLLNRIDSLHADGGIVDAEDGWSGQDAEATAMGAAMRTASSSARLGFTSIPTWGPLHAFCAAAGESVFGVIQMYGHSLPGPIDAGTIRAWWSRWAALFGARLIPAIAGWVANPLQQTAEGYAQYLAMLPAAPGAMVWLEVGVMPSQIVAGLRNYQPGGSTIGTLAQGALVFIARPAGLVTLGVVVAAVLAVCFVIWGATRA